MTVGGPEGGALFLAVTHSLTTSSLAYCFYIRYRLLPVGVQFRAARPGVSFQIPSTSCASAPAANRARRAARGGGAPRPPRASARRALM